MKILLSILLVILLPTASYGAVGADWDTVEDPYWTSSMSKVATSGIADAISTVVAVSSSSGSEANPILTIFGDDAATVGLTALAIKGAAIGLLSTLPEEEQETPAAIMSGVQWGATVNNLAIVGGASSGVALPLGILIGGYLIMCDLDTLPSYLCMFGGYDEEVP